MLWVTALGGCVLPVPTDLPRVLPAHGHTYHVHDRRNRPVEDDGVLIVHTFYHYALKRVDCYPIHQGRAVVPAVVDVRLQYRELWFMSPVGYLFLINGHHGHVYPLVPGQVFWNDYYPPSINRGRHILLGKPPPDVLRVFPVLPARELEILKEVAKDMRFEIESVQRPLDHPLGELRHNARSARVALQYIEARTRSRQLPMQERPWPSTGVPTAVELVPASRRTRTWGLTPAERGFHALEACDRVTLKQALDAGLDPNSYDVDPWTLLHRAVGLGDLEGVKMLVEGGADVNRKLPVNPESWHSSHDDGKVDYATLRLKAEGYSPLVLAACGGHLDILKYLEARGAKAITPRPGYTLLHAAADEIYTIHGDDGPGRWPVICYLLGKGVKINATCRARCRQPGGTALDVARARGKRRTAEYLKQHGARSSVGPTSRAASQPARPAGGPDP